MMQSFKLTKVSIAIIVLSIPLYAQENFQSINLAGTVIAENESGLSYEAQGCITEVSQEAVNSGLAVKDQVLVRLDDRTIIAILTFVNLKLCIIKSLPVMV